MSDAYSRRLRQLAHRAAAAEGVTLPEGVYLGLTGPSFETPAEIRAFRTLGADLVGMSTVHEVIAARHLGMEVLGFSSVTNMAAGVLDEADQPRRSPGDRRASPADAHPRARRTRPAAGKACLI